MKQLQIGTTLVLAAASSVLGGCFGPGPGYDHREVVYVDHSRDHDHDHDHDRAEHHEDHHDEHHDDQGH